MTTLALNDSYGSSAVKDQFKCGDLPGKYYTLTDKTTGNITVMRLGTVSGASTGDTGADMLVSHTIGTIDKDTKTFVGEFADPSGTNSELNFFNSDEGTTAARQAAMTTTVKAIAVETGSYRTAAEQTQALFGTNQSAAEEASGDSTTSSNAGSVLGSVLNLFTKGTRTNFGGSGNPLVFPAAIRSNGQDVIKFNMMEYVPSGAGGAESGNFGSTGEARKKNRKIIGSVILPIPSGIADSTTVDWGSNSMSAAQMAAANIGKELLGDKGAEGSIDKTIDTLTTQNPAVAEAVKNALVGSATGGNPNALLGRSTGQVLNPNMELLFNGPALRPFSFNFMLSPRNSGEASTIVKILRFFKQGMAPIRTDSNLFLKSPYTFQMQYLRKGSEQHRFLNKFKECALQTFGVQYTPNNNYAVYEDGSMQSYSMSMSFTELEPVFSDDFPQDGDRSVGY